MPIDTMKIDIDEAKQKAIEQVKTVDILICVMVIIFVAAIIAHFFGVF